MIYKHKLMEKPTVESLLRGSLQEYEVTFKSDNERRAFIKKTNAIVPKNQTIREGKILRCKMDPEEAMKMNGDSSIESIKKHIPQQVRSFGFPSDQERIRPIGDEEKQIEPQETPILSSQALDRMATIQNMPDGFGVDVVIVDGIVDPNNPEFANNADGTGASRVNRLNWYDVIQYSSIIWDSYPYELIGNPEGDDNNHGTHVMGIACGNTQGWASKANLYNIIYNIPQIMWDENYYDLYLQAIKAWHQNKPINPLCGNKNPTITNHSYGSGYWGPWDIREILQIKWRGSTILPSRNYSGAQCTANLTSGSVTSITVNNGGSNYTNPPTVSFYGGGQAEGVAELANGSLYKIIITDGGSGYTKSNPPTVTFSAPPSGGVRATGTIVSERFLDGQGNPEVYIDENNSLPTGQGGQGQIFSIEITEAGSGYTSPPTVTFSSPSPGGRVAQATTEIKSNFIKRIRITNGGSGYFNNLSIPAIILSGGNPQVSADVSVGAVQNNYTDESGALLDGVYEPYIHHQYKSSLRSIEIWFLGGGESYQSAPIVSFYGGNMVYGKSTIDGAKPEAYCTLGTGADAGKVSSITVYHSGSGYTSPPNVVLTNGGGFTVEQLKQYGITTYNNPYQFNPSIKLIDSIPNRNSMIDEDITQLISAGVIVVAAAGNSYYKIDNPTGVDYNNSMTVTASPTYTAESSVLTELEAMSLIEMNYARGSSPGACPGVICVGAAGIGSPEYKATFSNTGPRIDVYAPGEYINSSTNIYGDDDPRNSNYKMQKWSGTSMASPQVAGMLACYAQTNRSISQASALNFINTNSKATMVDGTNYQSLQGGTNKYAFMPNINHTTS